MPIDEFIGEVILRPILELIFYGLFYWTGFLFLKGVSFGSIRLAPLASIEEKHKNKGKRYQIDWNIWIERPKQGKALKAECVCVIGMLVSTGIGCGIYFLNNEERTPEKQTSFLSPLW